MKYKLIDVTKFISVYETFRLTQQSLIKGYMLNEKFTSYFKITISWHLTKSHATRLKTAKDKTHVMKNSSQNK